ncbi:MAG TPA: hypothetical protein VGL86_14695 [Polyangia bacterium]|jgi:hypothetical protein
MTDPIDPRARLAWRGALLAAALNVCGSPLELVVAHNVVDLPAAPPLCAAATGLILIAWLLWTRDRPTRAGAAAAFTINTASIVIMLWLDNSHWVTIGPRWAPFQASKLGAITVGLLTPEVAVGVLSIAAYAGSAVVQWLTWNAAERAVLARGEPVPTLIFAAFGLVLLVFAARRYDVERMLVEEQKHAAALEQLARTLLAVRDFCNTPLQTIESATAVTRMHHPAAAADLERIERALGRLHELNEILSQHEQHLRWGKEDESFDALERLRRNGG